MPDTFQLLPLHNTPKFYLTHRAPSSRTQTNLRLQQSHWKKRKFEEITNAITEYYKRGKTHYNTSTIHFLSEPYNPILFRHLKEFVMPTQLHATHPQTPKRRNSVIFISSPKFHKKITIYPIDYR